MSDETNPWTIRGARVVHENPWIRVEDLDILNPKGAKATYAVVRFKKLAVGVLPIAADGAVHLVGQWRVPLGRYCWEMPEGGAEPGEDPRETAQRELEEEAGVVAGRLIEATRMALSNSVCDELAISYVALDLAPGRIQPEDTEVIRQRRAPFREVLAEVLDGRIDDSMTVATVLRAYHMARSGQLEDALARAMLGEE